MELEKKLVFKNKEDETHRLLVMGRVYSSNVKPLHDRTRDVQKLDDGYTDVVMRERFGRPNSNAPNAAQHTTTAMAVSSKSFVDFPAPGDSAVHSGYADGVVVYEYGVKE